MRRKKRKQEIGPSLNNCNGITDEGKKEECESRVMNSLVKQNKSSSGGKTKRRTKKSKKSKKKRRTRRKGKKSRKSRK